MMNWRCLLGHRDDIQDWEGWAANLKCARCGKVTPMTGMVLLEWIKYRHLRDMKRRVDGGPRADSEPVNAQCDIRDSRTA